MRAEKYNRIDEPQSEIQVTHIRIDDLPKISALDSPPPPGNSLFGFCSQVLNISQASFAVSYCDSGVDGSIGDGAPDTLVLFAALSADWIVVYCSIASSA